MTPENPAGLRETIHEATAAYCDHVIQPPQCQRIAMRVRELLAAAEPGLDVERRDCHFMRGLDGFTNCSTHGWSGYRTEVRQVRVCPAAREAASEGAET